MAGRDDIETPPDPHRPAKAPASRQAPQGDADAERLKREAVSALRRVGADRARLPERKETPRGLPVAPRDTLHDGFPSPSQAAAEPYGRPAGASLPPSSGNADAATIAALRAENEALRTGRKNSPSRGIPAQPGPTTVETDTTDLPISDAAIGRGVRHLLKRFWPLLVGAVGLGAGGAGALKPAADPAKTDAVAAELGALKRDHAVAVEQLTSVLKRESARERYLDCLTGDYDEAFAMLLPAPDRMGSARTPKPWVDRCKTLKP